MKFSQIINYSLLIIHFWGCSQSFQPQSVDALNDLTAEITITRIVDGDTYEFQIDSTKYKIRHLYIDAFEVEKNSRSLKQAEKFKISQDSVIKLGKLAKQFAIDKLLNRKVKINRDPTQKNTDIYNRYLRFIEVDGLRFDSLALKQNYFTIYEFE